METIFITGSNRSGTTWLNKMLSFSGKFVSVFEPFNHSIHQSSIYGKSPFTDHYHYVLEQEIPRIKRYINNRILFSLLTDQNTYVETSKGQHKPNKFIRLYRGCSDLISLTLNKKQILIKDPIALLSADQLAKMYSAKVIVLIRHPAAYVSSIKRLGWDMSLTSFSNQADFMATLPKHLVSEIRAQINNRVPGEGYNLEDAALSWKIFHYVIHQYRERFPDWIFIRHEDICYNYIDYFEQLYAQLSLEFTEEVRNSIEQYCNPQNRTITGTTTHVLKRDSNSIPCQWKQNLNQNDVNKIQEITADIANLFYDDQSWI